MCSLYNNIRTPGQLQPSATFYLFKEGIEPKWEDPKNASGGCWTASVNRGPNSKQQLDAWWLNMVRRWCEGARLPRSEPNVHHRQIVTAAQVLACIGEQFTEGDEVCGAAVNIRAKGDRIELWTKTASNEAVQVGRGAGSPGKDDIQRVTPCEAQLGWAACQWSVATGTAHIIFEVQGAHSFRLGINKTVG